MGKTSEAKRQRDKERYQRDRERIMERNRRYYEAHRDEINAKKRGYDEGRRTIRNARQRARYKAKKEAASRWEPVPGYEERYLAEEIGKYGPAPVDKPETRSYEEMEELRMCIYRVLGIRA